MRSLRLNNLSPPCPAPRSSSPRSAASPWRRFDASTYARNFLQERLQQVKAKLEESERELALFMDIALLSRCVELWVFGDVISAGMEKEIQYAQRKGKTIRYINEVK